MLLGVKTAKIPPRDDKSARRWLEALGGLLVHVAINTMFMHRRVSLHHQDSETARVFYAAAVTGVAPIVDSISIVDCAPELLESIAEVPVAWWLRNKHGSRQLLSEDNRVPDKGIVHGHIKKPCEAQRGMCAEGRN